MQSPEWRNEIKIYKKTEVINTIEAQTMHNTVINNSTSFTHVSLLSLQELSVNYSTWVCLCKGGVAVRVYTPQQTELADLDETEGL